MFYLGSGLQDIIAEQSHTVDNRTGQRMLEDDAYSSGGSERGEEDAFVAYSGAVGKGDPLRARVVGGCLNTECCDTLSEGDILLQHDAVEGDGVVECKGQRGGEAAVGDCPVSVVMGVEHLFRCIGGTTAMGGGDFCSRSQIMAKDAVKGCPELHQPKRIGSGY